MINRDVINKVKDMLYKHIGELSSRSMFGGFGLYQDDVMFAIIAEGSVYLRAHSELECFFISHGMTKYTYTKRCAPVMLRYYKVDSIMWDHKKQFVDMAKRSWSLALSDKKDKFNVKARKLRDLPNMNLSIERMLMKAGVSTIAELEELEELEELGAVAAYVKIKYFNSDLTEAILWALAGALEGCHSSVLSIKLKEQLAYSLRENYGVIVNVR